MSFLELSLSHLRTILRPIFSSPFLVVISRHHFSSLLLVTIFRWLFRSDFHLYLSSPFLFAIYQILSRGHLPAPFLVPFFRRQFNHRLLSPIFVAISRCHFLSTFIDTIFGSYCVCRYFFVASSSSLLPGWSFSYFFLRFSLFGLCWSFYFFMDLASPPALILFPCFQLFCSLIYLVFVFPCVCYPPFGQSISHTWSIFSNSSLSSSCFLGFLFVTIFVPWLPSFSWSATLSTNMGFLSRLYSSFQYSSKGSLFENKEWLSYNEVLWDYSSFSSENITLAALCLHFQTPFNSVYKISIVSCRKRSYGFVVGALLTLLFWTNIITVKSGEFPISLKGVWLQEYLLLSFSIFYSACVYTTLSRWNITLRVHSGLIYKSMWLVIKLLW